MRFLTSVFIRTLLAGLFILTGMQGFSQCQTVEAVISVTAPMFDADDVVEVCQGQDVTFTAGANFPQNGTTYTQSLADCSFKWSFGDGSTGTGQTVTHAYANGQGHVAFLTVTDNLQPNCESTNDENVIVEVSTTPDWSGSSQNVQEICLGEQATLTGVEQLQTGELDCTPPAGSLTFLPDGTGASYTSSLEVKCFFVSATVQNITDVESVCVNIEHSYSGDLDIDIICPNGGTVSLMNADIGRPAIMGEPLAIDLPADQQTTDNPPPPVGPGVGYDYCWSVNATNGLISDGANIDDIGVYTDGIGNISPLGGAGNIQQLGTGTYEAAGNWANLIGCPLNGNWQIQVTDNFGQDNGYIFSWSMGFDQTIIPNTFDYLPTTVTSGWVPDPDIVAVAGPTITVQPTTTGLHSYTYTVTDDYGCDYDTTMSVMVGQPITAGIVTQNNPTCAVPCDGLLETTGVGAGAQNTYEYVWSNGVSTAANAGICAGSYQVTISKTSCEAFGSYTITQPTVLTLTSASVSATCQGINTGSVDLSVAGGAPAYTYLWSNAATTQDITGLAPGNYAVTVSDINNCISNLVENVGTGVTITADGVVDGPHCVEDIGGNTATFTFDGSGSSSTGGAITGYNWSWADATANGTGVGPTHNYADPGSYVVQLTVTDGACIAITTLTATAQEIPDVAPVTTKINCNGAATGALSLSPEDGVSPYSYTWTGPLGFVGTVPNAGATDLENGLVAGTYTVTVSDQNGCVVSVTETLTEPTALTLTIGGAPTTCANTTDGDANINVVGGSTPYAYVWSNAATDAGITGLAVGTYDVTVTDAKGCVDTDSYDVLAAPSITLTAAETAATCGQPNGSVTVTAIGGAGGYQYDWVTAATVDNISGVAAGNYMITVTDAANCEVNLNTTVTGPTALVLNIINANDATCNGASDGTAEAQVTGGTTAYQYLWTSGETTAIASNLNAATHTVTITDGAIPGCEISANVVIDDSPLLTATITNSTSPLCNGATDGTAEVTAGGGLTNYAYVWNNGSTVTPANGFGAGLVQVTVTDAQNCTVTANVVLAAPSVLTLTTSATNESCVGSADGTASSTTIGGTTPYSYLWSNAATTQNLAAVSSGAYTLTVTDGGGCAESSTENITALVTITAAGTVDGPFCLTDIDGNFNTFNFSGATSSISAGAITGYSWDFGDGSAIAAGVAQAHDYGVAAVYIAQLTVTDGTCTDQTTVSVTVNAMPTVAVVVSQVQCNAADDGQLVATPANGTPDYGYTWTGPLGFTGSVPATGASDTEGSLVPGVYQLTVTDINGCLVSATETITEPTALGESNSPTHVVCGGDATGAVNVTITGGTTPYGYAWSNASTTQNINNVVAGNYSVTATDANGCSIISTTTINEPDAMAASVNCTSPTLAGGSDGSAASTTSGGDSNYSYLWSNGATTINASGLSAGPVAVTVTDGVGCPAIATCTVVNPPCLVSVTTTVTGVTCNGGGDGQVTAAAAGGLTPYTFNWSDTQTGTIAINLSTGNITVSVTDGTCSAVATVSVTQPTAVAVSVLCTPSQTVGGSSGTSTSTASGGTSGFTYLWSTAATTAQITGLSNGTYTVTVNDNSGCSAISSCDVNDPVCDITPTPTATDVLCFGGSTGTATGTTTGGITPYSYAWSNAATTSSLTGLPIGVYSLTITDIQLCTASGAVTVTEPTALDHTLSSINAACGDLNGSVTANPTGGTTPYSYTWSQPGGQATLTGLDAGTVGVTITDNNGCSVMGSTTLTNPTLTISSSVVTTITCNGDANGAGITMASGGTTPYSYSWTTDIGAAIASIDAGANSQITNVLGGVYYVSVVDASPAPNGPCQVINIITISEPTALTVTVAEDSPVACFGDENGSLNAFGLGGFTPYTYAWNTAATSQTISGVSVGVYTATITDNNGCFNSGSFTVSEPVEVVVPTSFTFCNTADDLVGLTASPAGGTWLNSPGVIFVGGSDNDSIDVDLTPWTTNATPYELVYSVNGCTDTADLFINGAIAGADQTLCEADSIYTFDPVAQPAGGLWSGQGLTDFSAGITDISGLVGDIMYVYTSNGCPDTMILTVNPIPPVPNVSDIVVCENSPILFEVVDEGASVTWYSDSLLTDSLDSTLDFEPDVVDYDTTITYYAMSEALGCTSAVVSVQAEILDSISTSFTPSLLSGTAPLRVDFINTSQIIPNVDIVNWVFGDGDSTDVFSPAHTYRQVGTFTTTLYVTDAITGCIDSLSVEISTDGTSRMSMPNVFTPNGDGMNDLFTMEQVNLTKIEVQIFNRWGQLLYNWNRVGDGWDGRTVAGEECPEGVYFATVYAEGLDENGEMMTYGINMFAFTLLR